MSEKSGAESARSPSDESIVSAESENYAKDFKAMKEYMQKMEKHLIKTECVRSEFSKETGLELYLKKECCQITKSCHARSALCTLLSLSTEQKQCGVITALQEDVLPLCHFGNVLNIPVEIVLPNTTLSSKINELKKYKATLTIKGKNLDEAEKIASELATKRNMYCIERNDKARYFGYGTTGIEIIDQVPNVEVIVVPDYEPIFLSIITVINVLKPSVKIIIAAPSSSSRFSSKARTTPSVASTRVLRSSKVEVQFIEPIELFSSAGSTLSSLSVKSSSSSNSSTLSSSSVEPSPSSKNLPLSFSTTKILSSSICASDKVLLPSTDSIPSRLKTSCELAQFASLSQQKRESLDNANVTSILLTENERDKTFWELFKKERIYVDQFGAMSLAACLQACSPGSLFDAYKNKSVVSLLASSAEDDFIFSLDVEALKSQIS